MKEEQCCSKCFYAGDLHENSYGKHDPYTEGCNDENCECHKTLLNHNKPIRETVSEAQSQQLYLEFLLKEKEMPRATPEEYYNAVHSFYFNKITTQQTAHEARVDKLINDLQEGTMEDETGFVYLKKTVLLKMIKNLSNKDVT